MRCLKLLILSLFLSSSYIQTSFSVEQNSNSKKTFNNTIKKRTKTSISKKNIIRNTKKKQEAIKSRPTQLPTKNAYQISRKTINIKSPMCQYAKKNDVIALKKALMASNYDESEVNTICSNGESLLMIAVKNNNFLSVKLLIEKGANLNLQNDAGVAPLHIIARTDTNEIDRIFDLIIRNKDLNLNIKDNEGYTPLMRAVDFEKIPMIEKIVSLKVDKSVKNNYGYDALSLAKKNLEGKKTDEERAVSEYIIQILKKR